MMIKIKMMVMMNVREAMASSYQEDNTVFTITGYDLLIGNNFISTKIIKNWYIC